MTHRPGYPPGVARNRGFSLVELVLVLAIVTVVAAIAAPRYASSIANYRAEAAARRVASDLDLAGTWARTTSTARTITFTVASNRYAIVDMTDPDRPLQAYQVDLSQEPYRGQLVSADFGGNPQATFTGYGTPTTAGTVVVAVNQAQRTVRLRAPSGQVTVE